MYSLVTLPLGTSEFSHGTYTLCALDLDGQRHGLPSDPAIEEDSSELRSQQPPNGAGRGWRRNHLNDIRKNERAKERELTKPGSQPAVSQPVSQHVSPGKCCSPRHGRLLQD